MPSRLVLPSCQGCLENENEQDDIRQSAVPQQAQLLEHIIFTRVRGVAENYYALVCMILVHT